MTYAAKPTNDPAEYAEREAEVSRANDAMRHQVCGDTPPCRLVTEEYRAYPAVSQSTLKLVWRSPQLYEQYHIIHTRKPPGPSPQMEWGSQCETFLKSNGETPTGVVVVPEDVLTKNGQKRGNAYDAWKAEHPGKAYWTPDECRKNVGAFEEALYHVKAHKVARHLICDYDHVEWHARFLFTLLGETMKCELDIWHRHLRCIVDVKTAADTSERKFASAVEDFGYDVQAAAYLDAMEQNGYGRPLFSWVVIRNTPPYDVEVYEASNVLLSRGREKLERYMEWFQRCRDTGVWRSPTHDTITTLYPPRWAKEIV